ncbi:hypothetical protein PbB2_02545 [Candidatus Phycosocius bacilliformis]|uniref:Uncharacterized protein n=1 Tax=Candidatus Phycosocius bacilliformis TaxID=1445552 RepID=A0A2P2ECS3_9PROT|nr:hypothetical protein PbB2_02545 [Candidatus Phycosocius bacilliformis]
MKIRFDSSHMHLEFNPDLANVCSARISFSDLGAPSGR